MYAAALWALVRYLQRPDSRGTVLLGVVTAVAFLFRHDHGVWIAGPAVVAIALLHWPRAGAIMRAVAVFGGVAAALAAPWMIWVLTSGHAAQYFDFLSGQSRGLTNRTRLPDRVFHTGSTTLLTLRPIEYPLVGIRWAGSATSQQRHNAEVRYGLERQAAPDDYRLRNLQFENVRALVQDPIIEDTRGIDRGTLRVPGAFLPWLDLQIQRYLPWTRLRPLPGVISAANAEPWLTWVTYTLPWVVLSVVAAQVARARYAGPAVGSDPHTRSQIIFIIAAALLSIITYQTLVRASPDSRLGDLASVTAVLMAWLAGALWHVGGRASVVIRGIAIVLVGLTLASALEYGRLVPRLAGVGVDGPVNLVRRAVGQFTLYAQRPLDLYAPAGTGGLAGLARWLNECTIDGDRASIIGFEPQVFFLAERGFAGGLAFYDLGWNSSDRDQALTIERWQRQHVPVVLAMATEWGSFSRDYTTVRAFIDDRYETVAESKFGGSKQVTVLVDRTAPRHGTHAATGLPCFR